MRSRALFKRVGPGGVRQLQTHSRDSIAIQAAWEEVALTVPEPAPEAAVPPDPHKLNWFLGFLEGRAHVRAPRWWSEALLGARANRRDNIYLAMGTACSSGSAIEMATSAVIACAP